jgi:hypothetical protein
VQAVCHLAQRYIRLLVNSELNGLFPGHKSMLSLAYQAMSRLLSRFLEKPVGFVNLAGTDFQMLGNDSYRFSKLASTQSPVSKILGVSSYISSSSFFWSSVKRKK